MSKFEYLQHGVVVLLTAGPALERLGGVRVKVRVRVRTGPKARVRVRVRVGLACVRSGSSSAARGSVSSGLLTSAASG